MSVSSFFEELYLLIPLSILSIPGLIEVPEVVVKG